MLLLMPLLLYLTFVMPFRICFANDPVIGSGAYWFEFSIEVVKKHTHTHTKKFAVGFAVDFPHIHTRLYIRILPSTLTSHFLSFPYSLYLSIKGLHSRYFLELPHWLLHRRFG
jgi:hypothetical protein